MKEENELAIDDEVPQTSGEGLPKWFVPMAGAACVIIVVSGFGMYQLGRSGPAKEVVALTQQVNTLKTQNEGLAASNSSLQGTVDMCTATAAKAKRAAPKAAAKKAAVRGGKKKGRSRKG